MVGLDQQSAPKELINEVPSHVVLVNNKVGAMALPDSKALPDSSRVKPAVPDSDLGISEFPKVYQNPFE